LAIIQDHICKFSNKWGEGQERKFIGGEDSIKKKKYNKENIIYFYITDTT
jgi:hypothetical protein